MPKKKSVVRLSEYQSTLGRQTGQRDIVEFCMWKFVIYLHTVPVRNWKTSTSCQERSWLCGVVGYHFCLTHRRSLVQTQAKSFCSVLLPFFLGIDLSF